MGEDLNNKITANLEAKPKDLTPDISKASYRKFCSLRSDYYRKGVVWLGQFVKKRDAIKPSVFACTAGIGEERFSSILNGKSRVTPEMYVRIAIGIGLFWNEIVALRLGRFHDRTNCLSEKSKQEIKQKRINDLKDEYISHFGNEARVVLDMLDHKENLLPIANYYKEKYLHRFDKKNNN